MFSFSSPYYMQIHQTALVSFLPHPSQRANVLLQSDLIDMILSCYLMPCMISIWRCDMILPKLLYNTHL